MLDDDRLELEVKLGQSEDKKKNNRLYCNILTTFGVALIAGSAISVIWYNLTISVQEVSFIVMGAFLIGAAMFWRKNDEKTIAKLQREIKLKKEKEYEGYNPKNL